LLVAGQDASNSHRNNPIQSKCQPLTDLQSHANKIHAKRLCDNINMNRNTNNFSTLYRLPQYATFCVSTLFERMVEHEFFMATAPSLHASDEKLFSKRRGTSEPVRQLGLENNNTDLTGSLVTSQVIVKNAISLPCSAILAATNETLSASPPESSGSGPSYTELNRLANVNR